MLPGVLTDTRICTLYCCTCRCNARVSKMIVESKLPSPVFPETSTCISYDVTDCQSALQGCSLSLKTVLRPIFVMPRSQEIEGRSRSQTHLVLTVKRLGLVSVSCPIVSFASHFTFFQVFSTYRRSLSFRISIEVVQFVNFLSLCCNSLLIY